MDLTSRKIYVKNEDGKLMNAVDIFHINQTKTLEGLTAKYYDGDSLVDRPYKLAEQESDAFYFSRDAELNFVYPARKEKATLLEKVNRYFTQGMIVYSLRDLHSSNFKYYFKILSFLGLITVSLIWFSLFTNIFFRRTPSNK